jgi:flagellar hook-basal body complex protein FliE
MLPAVGAVSPALPLQTAAVAPVGAPAVGSVADDGGFAGALGSAIDGLQQLQSTSQTLAVQAVTGELDDVHDYTIASAQAATALELTAAVRNKAVEAFTEIMRMQA